MPMTPLQSPTNNNLTSILSNSTPSYADKAKNKITPITNFTHPSTEQGIIFECSKDLKLVNYLLALKNYVGGPKNIIAASKASNNHIIVHLKDVETVNLFMSSQNGIFRINNEPIKWRTLKSPARKIIFSQVSREISNELLLECITDYLQLSPTSILRYPRNGFHWKQLKRQL